MTMAGSGAGAIALGLAGGYLLGSIPFGLVLTRFAGLGDIRRVGSGNIVGLPGQTVRTLARDIAFLRDLDVEMAGIGPFIPHPGTPLASCP